MKRLSPLQFMDRRFPLILVALITVVALWLSTIVPPFQGPDEYDHIRRAHLLGQGKLLLDSPPGQSSGGPIDDGLSAYMALYAGAHGRPKNRLNAGEQLAARSLYWTGQTKFEPAPGTGYYPPIVYLPQAAGLAIGKSLDWSIDRSYRLARALATLSAALLLAIAFMLYPPPFLALAMVALPMTLFMMATAALDGIVTGLALVALASFLRLVQRDGKPNGGLLLLLLLSLATVVATRPNLLPALCLPFVLYAVKRQRGVLLIAIAAVALAGGWVALAISHLVDLRVLTGASTSHLLHYYLESPARFFSVVMATVADENWVRYIIASYIGLFGWLDTQLPNHAYYVLMGALAAVAGLSLTPLESAAEWPSSLALALCGLGATLLVFLALLVTWTPHPAGVVQGIQGRYFLIPSLFLAFALSDDAAIGRARRTALQVIVGGSFLFAAITSVTVLMDRYA